MNRYNVFLIWKREALEDNQAGRSTFFTNSQYWVASNLSRFILQKRFQVAERNLYCDEDDLFYLFIFYLVLEHIGQWPDSR